MVPATLYVLLVAGSLLGCGDDDVAGDAGPTDAGRDTAAPDGGPACSPATPGDPVAGRWALSLFHFNVQYVPGGLDGMFPPPAGDAFHYDNDQTEDLIIRESFLPVLDILEAHPSWQLTLEMQGLMLEVLAARWPDDLARLVALVSSRQVELASAHYADQLLLAYPRGHIARSLALTNQVAATHGITPSGAIFTQEGFFGHGLIPVLTENERSIAAIGRNLVGFQRDDVPAAAYYELDAMPVLLAGNGAPIESGAEMRWSFFGDGELLATGVAPYLGDYFRRDEALVQAYVDELTCLEAQGFRIGRIDDYVAALQAASIAPQPLPAILDGDWQPRDTRNVGLWLGGLGRFNTDEDNAVVAENHRAGFLLGAAETLFGSSGSSAIADGRARLDAAWRDLFLAEVSDSTGWNPWLAEIRYSRDHAASVVTQASAIIRDQLAALGWTAAEVDPGAGTAVERTGPPPVPVLTDVSPAPVDVTVTSPGRPVALSWKRRADGVLVLDVTIGPATDPMADRDTVPVTLTFPSTDGRLRYSPAFLDVVEDHALSDFSFEEIWLPVPNGLAGIDGGFLVQDHSAVHLAFGWSQSGSVRLLDETLPPDQSARWRILFTDGDGSAAVALARATNDQRALWVCGTDAACGL